MSAGENEAQTLEAREEQERAELLTHQETVQNLEEESVLARELLQAKTAERDSNHASLRERERGIEAARMHVLKLLGEASTLRNQLAQIDEYLASMERDFARSAQRKKKAHPPTWPVWSR